ncbi:hypothetical protein [Vibrio vulnificus]|uniref:hypothetical protein n=1 Tax=Vibrio vulnificus TaxID=672 RepID=UPI0038CD6247
MNEGFLRQRRNLYVVNGVLLFCFMAKVEISQLTIIGISFNSFESPEITFAFLWFIWLYLAYRFIVYFVEYEYEYEYEYETLRDVWIREIERYTNKWLSIHVSKLIVDGFNENVNSYHLLKKNRWVLRFPELDENGNKVENTNVEVSRFLIFKYEICGVLRFIFLTTVVTDYFLPFFFCVFVFWVVGLGNWQGSMLELFN